MGFEMRGIDHQTVRPGALRRQLGEDTIEHAKPAPADEAVVDRLVRAVILRRIAPAQSIADHEDNPRDHTPVIDPRNTMRQRKIRFDPAHLRTRQPKQITHRSTLPAPTMNQTFASSARKLIGPEPSPAPSSLASSRPKP